MEIDQAVTVSHEDNTRITPNLEAKPPRPKKRESSLKSEFKKVILNKICFIKNKS